MFLLLCVISDLPVYGDFNYILTQWFKPGQRMIRSLYLQFSLCPYFYVVEEM